MPAPTIQHSSLSSDRRKKMKFTTVVALTIAIPLTAAMFAVLASVNMLHYKRIGSSGASNGWADSSSVTKVDQHFGTGAMQQQDPEEYSSIGRNVKYHIIFSTGCSIFQDWQSYIFFYFAL